MRLNKKLKIIFSDKTYLLILIASALKTAGAMCMGTLLPTFFTHVYTDKAQ
jgi:hypothetical protein